jgi:glycosyltransferase involved in cell wall biosynthesis
MKDPKVEIIIPVHGKAKVGPAITSVKWQDYRNLEVHLAADVVDDETSKALEEMEDYHIEYHPNETGERLYALQNICRVLDLISTESIVGIVDGDDHLMDNSVVSKVVHGYQSGASVVWTGNFWRKTGENCCSGYLPPGVDPYKYPWVSSHFRTFPMELYRKVPKANFFDAEGNWFKRTYDQALMLPILHLAHKKPGWTLFIPERCYMYCGTTEEHSEDWNYQAEIERFIRQRGFVSE